MIKRSMYPAPFSTKWSHFGPIFFGGGGGGGGKGVVTMNNKLTSFFFVRLSSEFHNNSVEVAPTRGSTRKIG